MQHGKTPVARLDLDNDPVVVLAAATDEYDVELSDKDDARCVAVDDSRPIRVETWQGGAASAHTWQDYIIGERITVGVITDGSKSGIELTIAGNPISGELIDIWTLDDLRQLRDDLSDLLADDRLLAATGSAQPTASPIRVERPAYDAPCTDYRCGHVILEVLDDPKADAPGGDGLTVYNFGGDCIKLTGAEQAARDLLTLLVDPRVRAAIEARRSPRP